ncbi:4-coumarate--CoA ligase-like 9 [Cynara cardunculus var. scolymus]|uniref:4-coumarate--CoA ligase-like 9 n=1 Tax=Cynara cardunculus var. scolymus TaxID=59895 RepID=UPI000D62C93A|nr:4-coumarate--CoA ligase-like 9 [Cynara cardunculus var. scolymus]
MADASFVNPQNGFCSKTNIFHSLRSSAPLPPPSQPLSITDYTLYLLRSNPSFSPSTTPFLIDSATGHRLFYSDFIRQFQSLSAALVTKFPSLAKNQVALIVSPPSFHIPVLYFSLLSLGVTVSPVNPISTESELADLVRLSNPVIAFAISSVASKLPSSFPLGTIIIDSPQFLSMLQNPRSSFGFPQVKQSDTAGILYSSGTTGKIKGVELSHRNFIAITSASHQDKFAKDENAPHPVSLFPLPLFHVFGFFMLIRAASLGETLVFMERFDFVNMLKAVEKYRVTYMPVSPPLVVALAKSDVVPKYDLSSLLLIGCGGAPLGKEVAGSFMARFPHVEIVQGYGMTETGGGITGMIGPDECQRYGSAGRLSANVEAKIVDPETGEALSPMQQGELWLRGPMIMKGYVEDKEATGATLDSEGWLKTGDLCYFDSDGFLYVVDRLKELIKYKAYQVAPAELERYLQSIPQVADAAVIPYPDEAAGQIPMAYVVRRDGSKIKEAEIMEIIAKQVSPYKKIRRVAFIKAIPKTAAGKILRKELVKHAAAASANKL